MKTQPTLNLDSFIEILKSINPSFSKDELNLPLRETCIDSLDLVIVRVELEKVIGATITDVLWYGFNTIQEIYEYCNNLDLVISDKKELNLDARISRKTSINMPQMSNSALSENWLLKELGDIHWGLLSNGIKMQSSKIFDEQNERLYATFTRIKFKCVPLSSFNENETIEFIGQMNRYGNNTFLSQITCGSDPILLSATLMTNFTKRNNQQNNFLQKSTPKIKEYGIPPIEHLPTFLNEYRLHSKNLTEDYSLFEEEFNIERKNIYEIKYNLNPFYEINGVGLLYFSSYPVISDFCLIEYFNQIPALDDFDINYFTISRDIFYYANCEYRDLVKVQLNSYKSFKDGKLKIFTSLIRDKDNKLMADIFTIKEKITTK